jgi:hypothetical protein
VAEADPSIFAQMKPVEVREAADFAALSALLDEASAPFVVRGLVNDWPLVAAGRDSPRAARSYLLDKAHPVPFEVTIGQPGRDGRISSAASTTMKAARTRRQSTSPRSI